MRTDFARSSDEFLQYALVQDGTDKTFREIHNMDRWDRYLTALVRARWYQEKKRASERNQSGP
ncbi:hypothetical protein OSG_eHP10_00055 [environmental Halophage eHP-10]|nr:hypothetical protein OSG_eHP10_00055 [environmental Halophage eHP-10]